MKNYCLLILMLVYSSVLLAQESPSSFFDQGYAKTPLVKEKKKRSSKETTTKKLEENEEEASQDNVEQALEGFVELDENKGVLDSTYEVKALSAIIDANDQQHFSKSLKTLTAVANKYDFEIGNVYIIGTGQGITELKQELSQIITRKGHLEIKSKVPEIYSKVENSPTWVVHTEQGQILLEGYEKLGTFFNSKGEFLNKGVD